MSNTAVDPPDSEVSPAVDLLSGDVESPAAAAGSFTIDDEGDGEGDDVPTPLKERTPLSGSEKRSKSGAKMAKLSDKTSKIMNDYQAYLQEIETEFPSDSVIAETTVNQVKDSIRSGYQEKNAAPPAGLAAMTKESDPSSDIPLRRGWDGDYGDDEEEGTLDMRDHLVTRRKYTHPLLHSKRFKKAVCMTVSVAAIIAISVSVGTNKKGEDANLPDWEGEYAEIESEGGGHENSPEYQQAMSYQMAAMTYQPVSFNREQDNNYPDGSYRKSWEFCVQKQGYGLCPFAAVCPNGPGSDPIKGVKEGGPSWIPVSDSVDEYVQIAADGKCSLYSQTHDKPPEWGVMGGNDNGTRNLICCKQIGAGEIVPAVATSASSAGTSSNSVAIEFDRTKDWTGQTYGQAADFCGQKGYSICPFDVICPDGMNHVPSTGLKPGSDGQWAPISDEIHDWVQVGTDIPCTRWLGRNPDPPVWSQNGIGNEEITRYIYCCPGTINAVATSLATAATTTTTTTKPPVLSQNSQNDSNAAALAPGEEEEPPSIEWFDRSTGWMGQTYADAFNFCMDSVQALPCRYEAICPYGSGTIPFDGFQTTLSEAWVPIMMSDSVTNDNAWVSVSPQNPCKKYDRVHAAPPAWGLTGEGNEEITRLVACCHETRPPTKQVRYSYLLIIQPHLSLFGD